MGKKVPRVGVDVIVWISKRLKFRSLIEDVLGEDSTCVFRTEDSQGRIIGKPKPILFPADPELLKKINISFETPMWFGNEY